MYEECTQLIEENIDSVGEVLHRSGCVGKFFMGRFGKIDGFLITNEGHDGEEGEIPARGRWDDEVDIPLRKEECHSKQIEGFQFRGRPFLNRPHVHD